MLFQFSTTVLLLLLSLTNISTTSYAKRLGDTSIAADGADGEISDRHRQLTGNLDSSRSLIYQPLLITTSIGNVRWAKQRDENVVIHDKINYHRTATWFFDVSSMDVSTNVEIFTIRNRKTGKCMKLGGSTSDRCKLVCLSVCLSVYVLLHHNCVCIISHPVASIFLPFLHDRCSINDGNL